MNDILHDTDGDLLFKGGDLVIGDSTLQEVGIILQANPGDVKSDPILGVGLTKYTKSKMPVDFLEATVKTQLKRDGKDYNQIKKLIKIIPQTL